MATSEITRRSQQSMDLAALTAAVESQPGPDSPVKIAIVIEGGCVVDVYCEQPIEYEIFDYDDLEDGMSKEDATSHVMNALKAYQGGGESEQILEESPETPSVENQLLSALESLLAAADDPEGDLGDLYVEQALEAGRQAVARAKGGQA